MAKIMNDAYFTPDNVVKFGWKLIDKHIGLENITEVIESSAGAGAWLRNDLDVPFKAYDIDPKAENIEKQDFLELKLDYKPGRLIGFNPPFGARNNLSRQFYKKAVGVADYIAFVQPISQLDNPVSLYEFDLICSVDLGTQHYTDRNLHCCFNIWKRPENGLNKVPSYKSDKFEVKDCRRYLGKLPEGQPDIRLNTYGYPVMEVLKEKERSKEMWIYLTDKNDVEPLIEWIESIDWIKKLGACGSPGISKIRLERILKEEFYRNP